MVTSSTGATICGVVIVVVEVDDVVEVVDVVAAVEVVVPERGEPDTVVTAIKASNWNGGLMQYAGPVIFNDLGDNPNAIPTMIEVLGQKPVAVWPKDAAVQKFVFPRPKA